MQLEAVTEGLEGTEQRTPGFGTHVHLAELGGYRGDAAGLTPRQTQARARLQRGNRGDRHGCDTDGDHQARARGSRAPQGTSQGEDSTRYRPCERRMRVLSIELASTGPLRRRPLHGRLAHLVACARQVGYGRSALRAGVTACPLYRDLPGERREVGVGPPLTVHALEKRPCGVLARRSGGLHQVQAELGGRRLLEKGITHEAVGRVGPRRTHPSGQGVVHEIVGCDLASRHQFAELLQRGRQELAFFFPGVNPESHRHFLIRPFPGPVRAAKTRTRSCALRRA